MTISCMLSAHSVMQIYAAKHASNKKDKWVSGNLLFFRMNRISDIYFVGGFGTVQWVNVADNMNTRPDSIVAVNPQETITVSLSLSHTKVHLICLSLGRLCSS